MKQVDSRNLKVQSLISICGVGARGQPCNTTKSRPLWTACLPPAIPSNFSRNAWCSFICTTRVGKGVCLKLPLWIYRQRRQLPVWPALEAWTVRTFALPEGMSWSRLQRNQKTQMRPADLQTWDWLPWTSLNLCQVRQPSPSFLNSHMTHESHFWWKVTGFIRFEKGNTARHLIHLSKLLLTYDASIAGWITVCTHCHCKAGWSGTSKRLCSWAASC